MAPPHQLGLDLLHQVPSSADTQRNQTSFKPLLPKQAPKLIASGLCTVSSYQVDEKQEFLEPAEDRIDAREAAENQLNGSE